MKRLKKRFNKQVLPLTLNFKSPIPNLSLASVPLRCLMLVGSSAISPPQASSKEALRPSTVALDPAARTLPRYSGWF